MLNELKTVHLTVESKTFPMNQLDIMDDLDFVPPEMAAFKEFFQWKLTVGPDSRSLQFEAEHYFVCKVYKIVKATLKGLGLRGNINVYSMKFVKSMIDNDYISNGAITDELTEDNLQALINEYVQNEG